MQNYMKQTALLDFSNAQIQQLIEQRNWLTLTKAEQIKAVYNFVRDEITFGYNTADDIPASQVLADGYGQCNTKGTLLMALLRALGIASRLHGSTIDKALQKGAISGIWYLLAPKNIVHAWVEVFIDDNWYALEGVIIDKAYLRKLQEHNHTIKTTFRGYGVYTDNFANPPIDWDYSDTYIQSKGVNQDFGIFDSPDDFYPQHQQKLNLFKKMMFKYVARHFMNANVKRIRDK